MKMFNRKPCMKCGGKVMKRGGLAKMQTGGTPPFCNPGYIQDPNNPKKCIPVSSLSGNINFIPTTNFSLSDYKEESPDLISGLKNEGVFRKCPPGYIFNGIQEKCIPNPDLSMTLDNPITGTSFQILTPSGMETSLSGCPPGQIKNIVTGECETPSTTTTTTIPKVNFPGNVKLEIANSFVNSISRAVASNRNFNEYFDRQNFFRTPINDWATNEQKGVPGYNTYFKSGGSINNNKNNNMINIKKENRGKFTAQAKRAGMGVQEFANYVLGNRGKFSDATVKRANFARNSAGWKKEFGGTTMYNPYYDQLYMMQDGGAMPMEGGMEGQAGGEDQMQQIIMMIVEALKEGMAPEEIIQALVQMGIPQEQAVQILQAVVEQLQQDGEEGQMQGAPMEGQQQQAMAQQAAPPMRRGGYKMQQGGSMDDQTNMIIESYSQLKGISPEQLMQQISQQLQSVPPGQRNQTLQTILKGFAAEIQQAQQGAEAGQMQQEQGMMRLGGMHSNYYR
jgi:hypothetical protein